MGNEAESTRVFVCIADESSEWRRKGRQRRRGRKRRRRRRRNRQLRAVMDSGTLALLYFDAICLDGSRAAGPEGDNVP